MFHAKLADFVFVLLTLMPRSELLYIAVKVVFDG
jgi:hypothetical protein